jgi:molybdopterin/thiamine biosynthesis adenylyltransferase
MAVTPWWVDYPGTLHEEITALERAGITHEVREDLKAQGLLQIDAAVEVDGETIDVEIVYPDYYPFVRFEVYAPTLELPRHQNPFEKNLCLIARATDNWQVDDTAADFLAKRLPMVLEAGRAPAGTSSVPEEPQGEPMSSYYPSLAGAMILIDSAWRIPPDVDRGWLKIVLAHPPVRVESSGGHDAPVVHGAVAQIMDGNYTVLAEADPALLAAIDTPVAVRARWLRMNPPPRFTAEARAYGEIGDSFNQAWGGGPVANRYDRYSLGISAILFSEELAEATTGDGWLFHVQVAARGTKDRSLSYLARAGRAGRGDLAARIPELAGLRDKTILVVGVGGIGAPTALELARAGVGELRLIDSDYIDPGTSVRYPFGLASAGMPKVKALEEWVRRNLPYTEVRAYDARIGHWRRNPVLRPEQELWAEVLDGIDLVVDATAERGLHYLVANLARRHGVPYIEAATRKGAWGGVIARIGPDAAAPCWLCYQHALEERTEQDPPIAPSADPEGDTQPAGCADPTFAGAGFDLTAYAVALTRLIAGTLLDVEEGAYPSPPWDVAIYNLRDGAGILDTPTWQTWSLEPHPECPHHGS